MSRLGTLLLLVGMTAASAKAAVAQASPVPAFPVAPGQRVRVEAPGVWREPFVGRVTGQDDLYLSLVVSRGGSVIGIPPASVTSWWTSRGRDRGAGARRGAIIGIAAGVTLFATTYREIRDSDPFGVGTLALGMLSLGVVPSLGALVGTAVPVERWESQPLPAVERPPRAGVGVTLARDDEIRVTMDGRRRSGRVQFQTDDGVVIGAPDRALTVAWERVTRLSVLGEKSRAKGAWRGAIIASAITAVGVATDPLPTAGDNLTVLVGNGLFGAAIGALFPVRRWTDLPIPGRLP